MTLRGTRAPSRHVAAALILCALLPLGACSAGGAGGGAAGGEDSTSATVEGSEQAAAPEEESVHSRPLVAYFSRTGENYSVGTISEGNTAKLAEIIAAETHGELVEIVPVQAYPEGYDDTLEVATVEKNAGERPAYAFDIDDLSPYDTVFLGYPIWWGTLPMVIYSFLESYDFEDVTIYPFCTHEGSRLANTPEEIAEATGARVGEGLAVTGSIAQNEPATARADVQQWLESIGW